MRRILFPELAKDEKATVIYRWPLKLRRGDNRFSAGDFKTYEFAVISEKSCTVNRQTFDSDRQFMVLMSQFQAFSTFSGKKDHTPLRIMLDPEEPLPPLAPNEAEVTLEARCKDPSCDTFLMHQMEARIERDSKRP
jgi:hypothetical protein